MIRVQTISFFILLFLVSSVPQAQDLSPDKRGYIVKVGDKVDDFSFKLLDGSSKKISDYNASVIVLNFFASWCMVCRKEIPHIEKEVWQPMKDRGLLVLGVDYKEKSEISTKFVDEMDITYPVALDEKGKIFNRFARGGVTRNIVLDQNLYIIYLTRLFDLKEFEGMKNIIHKELDINADTTESNEGERKEMNQIFLKDMADTGKKIALQYQGQHKIHLEGRIKAIKRNKLEIGVSLFDEDIVSTKYDKKTKTLRIGYRHYKGVRIAILPMTQFKVPKDIEQVVVYDVEKDK